MAQRRISIVEGIHLLPYAMIELIDIKVYKEELIERLKEIINDFMISSDRLLPYDTAISWKKK